MLDMSWGEVMLIGGVALIVIGPKDLPKALRTLGQITTKVRRMAGEFQSQFNEAIREAELEEVRRDVEGVKRTVDSARPTFNPVDTIRNEIRSAVEGRPGSGSKDAEAKDVDVKDTGSFDVPRPTPGQQAEQMHGAPAHAAVETSSTPPGTKPETGPTP
ncbi:twin-arginine translocase subunit TatB [Methylorubrum sp. Q1]|uniref:Sec-independent protein translocase protein TatB n=1 Tax=Methylorubrum sp. Q1 TaxID=2562453 RepID=UPI0010766A98|nr:Sec-independent protein translocase protein TatB [Methylorubrum sp. Q1]TFZ56278.1 twin-arginine translocase subunit TatB [Methylorubrum sp. Q1]